MSSTTLLVTLTVDVPSTSVDYVMRTLGVSLEEAIDLIGLAMEDYVVETGLQWVTDPYLDGPGRICAAGDLAEGQRVCPLEVFL